MFVGVGIFLKEEFECDQVDFIFYGVIWIKEYVDSFQLKKNVLIFKNGESIFYDVLVVVVGIQIDWDKILGLKESVGKLGIGVVSNYVYEMVDVIWEVI